MPSINRISRCLDLDADYMTPEPYPRPFYLVTLPHAEFGEIVFDKTDDREKAVLAWSCLDSACEYAGRPLPTIYRVADGVRSEYDPCERDADEPELDGEAGSPRASATDDTVSDGPTLQVVTLDPSGSLRPIGESVDLNAAYGLLTLGERHSEFGRVLLRIVRDGDERLADRA